MNKQQAIAAVMAHDTQWETTQLTKLRADDVRGLLSLLEYEPAAPELAPVTGSKVRQEYRNKYAEIARSQGRKAQTASGRATLNNGDELALLLEYATPAEVCAIADQLLNRKQGTTLAKYTTDRIGQTHPKTGVALKPLNDGMVRMNAGNQVRSYCKKLDNPEDGLAEIRTYLEDRQATGA